MREAKQQCNLSSLKSEQKGFGLHMPQGLSDKNKFMLRQKTKQKNVISTTSATSTTKGAVQARGTTKPTIHHFTAVPQAYYQCRTLQQAHTYHQFF